MSARRMARAGAVGAGLSVVAVIVFLIAGLWEAAVVVVAGMLATTIVLLSILVLTRVTPKDVHTVVDDAAAAHRTEIRRVGSAIKSHRSESMKAAEDTTTSFAAMRSDIEGARSDLEVVRTDGAALSSRLSAVESQLAAIESRAANVESGLSAVEAGTAAIETAMTTGDNHRSAFERQLGWRLNRQVNQVEGLLQLYLHETTAGAMPLSGGWAVDPTSMSAALDAMERQRPQMVVELGSGASTAWVARLLERQGSGRVVSFDHERSFADVTQAGITRLGLDHRVDVRVVNLEPTGLPGHDTPWYDQSAMTDLDTIDVLFVDGPPQRTGAMARYPAVPALFDRLADGALVVIDDASRDDESAMIDKWQEAYPVLHEEIAIPRSQLRILRKH